MQAAVQKTRSNKSFSLVILRQSTNGTGHLPVPAVHRTGRSAKLPGGLCRSTAAGAGDYHENTFPEPLAARRGAGDEGEDDCSGFPATRRLTKRKTTSAGGFRFQASGRAVESSCGRLRCADAPGPLCMPLRPHLRPPRTARLAAPSGHGGKARPRICP